MWYSGLRQAIPIAAATIILFKSTPAMQMAAPVAVTRVVELAGARGQMWLSGFNDVGVCAGMQWGGPDSVEHAALLSEHGLTDMERKVGYDCDIIAINNRGQLLVRPHIDAFDKCYIWDNGRRIRLPTFGGKGCSANMISDDGLVVGKAERKDHTEHAFLYIDKRSTDLGTLGGGSSEATAVNASHQIVGSSSTPNGEVHAFVWQSEQMRDLGALDGKPTYAVSINNSGKAVGSAETGTNLSWDELPTRHAMLWNNGKMQDLNTHPCLSSWANAINDHDVIVGWAIVAGATPDKFIHRAIVWYADKTVDLNTLLPTGSHKTLTEAVAINNVNQVICYGSDRSVMLLQLRLNGEKF